MVTWREKTSENPSHVSDIDHERSTPIHTLASLKKRQGEGERKQTCQVRYHNADVGSEKRTLFVNAATRGQKGLGQPPWIVDIDLKAAAN